MTCFPGSARRAPLLALLMAGVMVLGLGACGRRGQPEPPSSAAPSASATGRAAVPGDARPNAGALATSPASRTQLTVDDETDEEDPNAGVSPQPTPVPARRRSRAYTVPKEPFILDPLL
ncbi:hypothetical protein [Enterovirga sp.]|jgi:hypothetical protein|uniref:hypothetical protein n=1 Tax=Enterovirga sp. TaxID=2026350 RepID=UPI002612D8AD|nr:hypothetical protein [Enterovirga sp.]MDB5592010.1 hypothetical protein [Enterovirga sp.]